MSDGFHTGWDHATWLFGYIAGACWPVVALIVLFLFGWHSARWIDHRAHVTRIRRQTRRTGRTT